MQRKLKPKREKSLREWLEPKLRRMSVMWPKRNDALNSAKVRITIGKHKNGNPIERVAFICAECDRQGHKHFYERKEVQVDHISPVVDIQSGFTNWDDYILSLFCGTDNLQVLCKSCHYIKSEFENELRVDKSLK